MRIFYSGLNLLGGHNEKFDILSMIIKCRICAGNGQVMVAPLSIQTKPCPACRGAGEFESQIPKERLTSCKYCAGRGIVQQSPFDLVGQVCSICKGIGLLERPVVGTLSTHKPAPNPAPTPRPTEAEYHVAISYASEDREIVRPYVQELVKRKLRVFYAGFDQSELWGIDLYDTLDAIYRLKAQYCVLFLSRHYAEKLWTNHERKAAQARAVQENREYILPVRLDQTEIPGLRPTIGYLDWNEVGLAGLLDATLIKLEKLDSR